MTTERVEKLLSREPVTTKAELSRILKVRPQALSNWFSRDNIPDEYSFEIANYFSEKLGEVITAEYLNGISETKSNKIKMVPITGSASCGSLEISTFQDYNEHANFNAKYWKKSLYCVIASGDSMSPEIDDGDEVIIDPDTKATNGDLVLYKIDDEIAIKVLYEDKDAHMIQFVPYNSSECFKTKTIRLDDEETITKLSIHKVVGVNKVKTNNRKARLKIIGR